MTEIVCANPECNAGFLPLVHNAIYCSPECRRIMTNKKVLSKYYEKKEAKNGKRVCANKICDTILSRYNKENICESCKTKRLIKRLGGWGWDEERLQKDWDK